MSWTKMGTEEMRILLCVHLPHMSNHSQQRGLFERKTLLNLFFLTTHMSSPPEVF